MTRPPYPVGPYPNQPYPPYAPPPVKKGKVKTALLIGCSIPVGLFILIVVIAVASSGGSKTPSQTGVPAGNEATTQQPTRQQTTTPAKQETHTIVYEVTGTAKTASNITYTTDGMTTSNQESNATLPWSKTITLPTGQAFQMVSVLAQGTGAGSIKVTITVDGKVFKEASADGYGVAMANGNIGSTGG